MIVAWLLAAGLYKLIVSLEKKKSDELYDCSFHIYNFPELAKLKHAELCVALETRFPREPIAEYAQPNYNCVRLFQPLPVLTAKDGTRKENALYSVKVDLLEEYMEKMRPGC